MARRAAAVAACVAAVSLAPASAQNYAWQLVSSTGPPQNMQGGMPASFVGMPNNPGVFDGAGGRCALLTASTWSTFTTPATVECAKEIGAMPAAGTVTGGWFLAGTPPNSTACTPPPRLANSSTGYVYTMDNVCSSGDGGNWLVLARNPAWAAAGPRVGHSLYYTYPTGLILFGGRNASTGAPLRDTWYTPGGNFNAWFAGAPLPAACFAAGTGAPAYASGTLLNRASAYSHVHLLCAGAGAEAAPLLYYLATGTTWVLVGPTAGLSGFAMDGQGASMIGQVIAAVSVEGDGAPPAGGEPQVAAGTSPELPAVYGCAMVVGGGTAGVATSYDGLTWRTVAASSPAYGTNRSRVGAITVLSSSTVTLAGGVGDGAACGAGGGYCTDTWSLPPTTCCVTGGGPGAYELCTGHGDCTPYNRYNFCTCADGWSGPFCDVTPSSTPSPSASPTRPSAAAAVRAGAAAVAVAVALAVASAFA
jgi:hypothetical protein